MAHAARTRHCSLKYESTSLENNLWNGTICLTWACSLWIVPLYSKEAWSERKFCHLAEVKAITAGVGRCWHPKKTVPRSNNSGLSQLRCKGWAARTPGCSFHLCECLEEKTQSRDTEPFRLLSALHWKSDECWQEQENSFWGDPGCWCQFQWQSHQTSGTDMRRVRPLPDKFCIYLFCKAIILIEKHVAWAIQQVTPKYHYVFKNQGRENRQD